MTPADDLGIREALTDALRFWEWWRILYNLVLIVVVVIEFTLWWPSSKQALHLNGLMTIFVQAVLANACYCAAYLAELFIQSEFREPQRKYRIALWLIGTGFALVCTHILATELFSPPDLD